MNNQKWQAIDIEVTKENKHDIRYLGVIEFQDMEGDYHDFSIVKTKNYLVFGGACNTGFLQSGFMEIDHCFSLDENIQELIADLETFYNDGADYTNMIVFNDRM